MKAIVFDLYDTILMDDFFDFNTGLEYLHDHYFAEECSVEDFLTFAMSFIPMYQERNITNKEITFLRDEYQVYCDQLEYTPAENPMEIEYQVMCAMQKESMPEYIPAVLNSLKEKGINLYLMTNSIFMAQSHKRLLKEFGIDKYFENLFCSADFGMRKPDKSFFTYVANQLYADGIKNEDILFVGNDYDTDVKPAIDAGYKAVWLTAEQNATEEHSVQTIKSLTHLIQID